MNFLLSAEQEQFCGSVARFARDVSQSGRRRLAFDADTDFLPELWHDLMVLGVGRVLVPAEHDGVGLEMIDAALVIETLGGAATPVPLLGHLLATKAIALAGDAGQQAHWLPRLADGSVISTIAIEGPDITRWNLHGEAGQLTGTVKSVPAGHIADLIVVGLKDGRLALVENGPGMVATPIDDTDRTRRIADIQFTRAPLVPLPDVPGAAAALVDAALVLLAADAFGGANACLTMASTYAQQREQFGRPIGSFQGLKFQLADMAVDVEPARGLYWYAAHAYDHVPAERSRMAAAAKAHLCDVYMKAARTMIEVYGGIGYTWEFDAHLYFRRAMFDYAWLGTPAEHRDRQAALAAWSAA
jgi:alkylation response protein AidB-like acyl-CoA dehydrogenase